jgi:hypothetical protein
VDPPRLSDKDDVGEANSRTVATADVKEIFIAIFRLLSLSNAANDMFVVNAKNER